MQIGENGGRIGGAFRVVAFRHPFSLQLMFFADSLPRFADMIFATMRKTWRKALRPILVHQIGTSAR